jgi:glyoxylase-like metal-dependent hydrolase (beta-lactamase superfamily II)
MSETFHFNLGEFHCLAVRDGGYAGDANVLFSNAPEEELSKYLDQYGESVNKLPSTWTCLLVKSDANQILVDTGAGTLGGSYGGNLEKNLLKAGWQPESIDTVILTHAHIDHIGGCIREDGTPAFPNARFFMSKAEWSFWMAASKPSEVSDWMYQSAQRVFTSLKDSVVLLKDETEIIPGCRILPAFGHTPGHIAVEIESSNNRLIYLSDIALHPIHIERPEWYAHVDLLPKKTIETRKRFYDYASETGCLVLMFHFEPFPSIGRIKKTNQTWQWQAVEMNSL